MSGLGYYEVFFMATPPPGANPVSRACKDQSQYTQSSMCIRALYHIVPNALGYHARTLYSTVVER